MKIRNFHFSNGIDIKLVDWSRLKEPDKSVDLHCWANYFSFHWDTLHNTIILDIGAEDGLYSLLAAKCGLRPYVISMEEVPWKHAMMIENKRLNSDWLVGEGEIPKTSTFNSILTPDAVESFAGEENPKRISIIRVNINSGKLELIQDYSKIIKNNSPTFFIKIENVEEYMEIRDKLGSLGYMEVKQINNYPEKITDSWYYKLLYSENVDNFRNNWFVFSKN